MRQVLTRLLDAAFPETCRLCSPRVDAAPWVCDRCIEISPAPPGPACAACGLDATPHDPLHRGPFVRAATCYATAPQSGATVALRMLKYDGRRRLARPLAALVHRRLSLNRNVLLIPVPLHGARLRERGFNQAMLLAAELAHLGRLPLAATGLRRTRETSSQARLPRAARLDNLAGAFLASPDLDPARPIVLVDDVATTGATLAACATALAAAGFQDVAAVVVARRVLLSHDTRTR